MVKQMLVGHCLRIISGFMETESIIISVTNLELANITIGHCQIHMFDRREPQIMDIKLPLISYTLATLSGICFIGGLVILSSEGEKKYVPTTRDIIDVRPLVRH